jgi:hypothetical protein
MCGLKRLLSLASTVAVAVAPPASAQCRLCDNATTQRPEDTPQGDVELRIETSLNFDRLILNGAGPGSVAIHPDGSNNAGGSVAGVGPRAMVGLVSVHGVADRPVRVELPHRIELYSLVGTGRIVLDDVTTDLPAIPRLDAAGNLGFHFGGRLVVTGDADGQYRGDLPITVEYQ